MTAAYRGLVDLYPEKCISCLQCTKICPTAALDLTAEINPETKKKVLKTFTFNEELCCSCGLCEEVCPEEAIFLRNDYAITTLTRAEAIHNKETLYKLGGVLPRPIHKWDRAKAEAEAQGVATR